MPGVVSRLRGYLELVRVVNSLMVGFAVLVGAAIVAGRGLLEIPVETIVAAFLTAFFISGSAMVLNDIVDVDIDRRNNRRRPLVTGEVSVEEAYSLYTATSLLGILASMALGLEALLLTVGAWALGSVYDVWGKVSGFPGNLMVAIATSLPFPFAMAVLDLWTPTAVVFWLIVFSSVLGREIAKDIADIRGDMAAGARTLPVLLGPRRAAFVAVLLYLAAVAMSVLPLYWGTVGVMGYLPLVLVVDAIFLYESYRILRDQSEETMLSHKKRVLLAMLLGLIAFLLGSLTG